MVTLIFTNEYANLLVFLYGLFILLFLYARRQKKQRAMKFGNYKTLKKVAGKNFIESSKILFALHLVAITALVIGVSSPTLVKQQPTASSDYAIAMDVSGSMFTGDIEPDRFQAAKQASQDFITTLGNNSRVGVVAFAGQIESTTDGLVPAPVARQHIRDLEIGQNPGTAIGDGIVAATNMLIESNRTRRIILITDGENNEGIGINESIELAQRHETAIFAVGIGSTANQTEDYTDLTEANESRAQFPNLNRDSLERLSSETGGNATFVSDRAGFQSALVEMTHDEQHTDLTVIFVMLGVLLLLIDWVFKTTGYAPLP